MAVRRWALIAFFTLILSCAGDSAGPIVVDYPPEKLAVQIVPGDTISGEMLDAGDDIDEFAFQASAGSEFNLFFQSQSGLLDSYMHAEVVDPQDGVVAAVESAGTDPSLNQITGRFAVSASGIYLIRVYGVSRNRDHNTGAYRFFLYPVNRAPESVSSTLTFGDSIAGESIEEIGDVDEFRVTVSGESGANLVVQFGPQSVGQGLTAQLLNSAETVIASVLTPGSGQVDQTAAFHVPAGTYTLRVDGSAITPSRGPYKVWLYKFSFGPESVADTLAIGDTVSAESLGPPGDVDVFRFSGVRGQHVNISIEGFALQATEGVGVFLSGPAVPPDFDPIAWVVSVGTPGVASQSLRLDLRKTGRYELHVSGGSSPPQLSEIGRYRLSLTALNTAPEVAPSALVPGDSITQEAIDVPGDWDEFTVTGTPGEELGLLFESSGTFPIYPWIRVFNPLTGDSLGTTVGQGLRFVGPLRVPASGKIGLAVYEIPMTYFRECFDATCGNAYRYTGGYTVRVAHFNRAPESVPAAYAVGDTVRGEAIAQPGDIDEFTSAGSPVEPLIASFRLTAPPVGSGYGLSLEIVDPATGAVLTGQDTQVFGQQFVDVGGFTVPASGNFLVRVRGSGLSGEETTTAPYEFYVRHP